VVDEADDVSRGWGHESVRENRQNVVEVARPAVEERTERARKEPAKTASYFGEQAGLSGWELSRWKVVASRHRSLLDWDRKLLLWHAVAPPSAKSAFRNPL
jgi:hypothetical protein